MDVTVGDTTYHVGFRNISERICHDEPPADVVAFAKRHKQHLKLKTPKRISIITTVCTISKTDDSLSPLHPVIAAGKCYYSRSEVRDGKPFNRLAAHARSFNRALTQLPADIDLSLFRDAFKHWYERRTEATRMRVQATADGSGRTGPPTVTQSAST